MKIYAKILSFLMAAILLLDISAVGVLAATSNVIFENEAEKFIFLPGSEYSDTDLFDNFKDMMPGDTRKQTVVISNNYRKFDRIRVFLRAIPHNEGDNPISESVDRIESLESMEEFLSKLTMTVRKGSDVIYYGSPNETDGLTNNKDLGSIAYGETVKLDVELSMPIELGNEYENRIGEVDWVFTVQQEYDPIIIPPITHATVSAVKLLDGGIPSTNEFIFQLSDSNGKVIQTVNNRGVEVLFNSMSYTMPGVYTYYLTEISGGNPEMEYDHSVYTVTVTVQNVGGFLNASVSYMKNGMPFSGVPTFYNNTDEDEDEPEYDPVSVSVWATKTLNQHLAVNSDFWFDLYDENGVLLQTKQNIGGYIFFDRIKFDKAGTYVFYITEKKGNIEDMIYDSSRYKVTVEVIEKGNELETVVSYEKNGLAYYDNPNFANLTEYDPEIPPTSDSDTVWLILSASIGVLAAVAVVYISLRVKRKN